MAPSTEIKHLPVKRQKLLRYVKYNDLDSLSYLLKREPALANSVFGQPYQDKTILQIACSDIDGLDTVQGATIQQLIDLGADCSKPSAKNYWEALHYAAVFANAAKLQVILKNLKGNQLNSLVHCSRFVQKKLGWCRDKDIPESYSNNALHLVMKYGNPRKQIYACVELLLKFGLNLDHRDSNGLTSRDLILSGGDHLLIKLADNHTKGSGKISDCWLSVQDNDYQKFCNLELSKAEANEFDGPDEDNSSCSLLQLCCVKGLDNFVERLLDNGASPTLTIRKNPNSPIMLAIKYDFENIVQMLLRSDQMQLPPDILIRLQRQYKKSKNLGRVDKYMNLVLAHLQTYSSDRIRIYLNTPDELNRTALHYSTYYGCPNVLSLLKMGASLTQKDVFGYTSLNYIEPATFEKFLDSCVELPKDDDDFTAMIHSLRNQKKNFALEIDYKNLINQYNDDDVILESEFLSRMIKTKQLKPYLNHPVISSYLAIKWQKYKWFYFVSLALYLVAYLSLLFYGFAFYQLSQVSNTFLLVSVLLLFVRESAHIFIFKLTRIETSVDILIIAGDIYILAAGWFKELLNQNLLVAFSLVFLLSTLGIFLQLGNLQIFAIKVIILRRITYNFCKYIIFYMFPILAFAFCFYMLAEDKDDLLIETIYRTITMFAGDPDSDYPDNFKTNPIFSHVIYVIFALLIGIVLQNLLVGLAVSDLQDIQKEAEFIDKKERAEYITKIEKVVYHAHKKALFRWVRRVFKGFLRASAIFVQDPVLVIQPYNTGCVFARENPETKEYISDPEYIDHLQNIFKNFSLDGEDNEDNRYLKTLNEKLQHIEALLQDIVARVKN